MLKRVPEHQAMPAWYGVAWRDFRALETVVAPVPLNLVAACARNVWTFLRVGHVPMSPDPRAAYEAGRRAEANRRDKATDVAARHNLAAILERYSAHGARFVLAPELAREIAKHLRAEA